MKKNAVAIIIFFALLLCALIWFKYLNDQQKNELYPKSTIVSEVNEDLITVIDFSGRVWQFYDDCEDWVEGDICALIMDNNGTTETVYDDIVIKAQYCGYVY